MIRRSTVAEPFIDSISSWIGLWMTSLPRTVSRVSLALAFLPASMRTDLPSARQRTQSPYSMAPGSSRWTSSSGIQGEAYHVTNGAIQAGAYPAHGAHRLPDRFSTARSVCAGGSGIGTVVAERVHHFPPFLAGVLAGGFLAGPEENFTGVGAKFEWFAGRVFVERERNARVER